MVKKLLDLFCKAGGGAMGYSLAGFEVIGVDIDPQPNYPFEFIQMDALKVDISDFNPDVIHASPPCQKYSWAAKRWKDIVRADLVEPVRKMLVESGKPYIIENVPDAPLINPIVLCGRMFGLEVIRHRLFESNVHLSAPKHHPHKWSVRSGRYMTVAGHGGDGRASYKLWCRAMGIDWMTKEELTQAIPPAYTEFIGKQLLQAEAPWTEKYMYINENAYGINVMEV